MSTTSTACNIQAKITPWVASIRALADEVEAIGLNVAAEDQSAEISKTLKKYGVL